MGDLRLKVRNKIYTSGNHIVDTNNNKLIKVCSYRIIEFH